MNQCVCLFVCRDIISNDFPLKTKSRTQIGIFCFSPVLVCHGFRLGPSGHFGKLIAHAHREETGVASLCFSLISSGHHSWLVLAVVSVRLLWRVMNMGILEASVPSLRTAGTQTARGILAVNDREVRERGRLVEPTAHTQFPPQYFDGS